MLLLEWYSLRFEPLCIPLDVRSIAVQTHRKVKKYRTSRLDDLSAEILLMILDYLPLIDVLRTFYSNNLSDRFHRLILEYRTEFVLWNLCYSDFRYLIDHIFSQSEILKLSLSNVYIPCLIEHFSSLCQESSLIELRELELDKCTFISPSLVTWISKQLKLEKFHCDYFSYKDSPLTLTQRSLLRDFFFNNGITASLHTLFFTLWPGLILSNQLPARVIAHLREVKLDLDTFNDLCILLEKKFLLNVRNLLIYINRPRQCSNQQPSSFPLHHHLVKFTLIEQTSGLTLNELASVLRAMPALQKLYVGIRQSHEISFARRSLVEAILPSSLVELHYQVCFAVPLPLDITSDINSDESARFPMKISDSLVYTIPWKWLFLDISIPACDYQSDIQRTIKTIWIWENTIVDQEFMDLLKPWYRVRTVQSKVKLPSLDIFRRLRALATCDSNIVHTTMPPTLRSLELTDETPLALNAPISTLVHNQIYRLIIARPIRDEQDLSNLLHQFPNLRYLTITLPAFDSHKCLANIFHKKTARLLHLICLQAHGGAMNLWKEAPYEWLISNTDLKYSSTLFYTTYNENDGLVIWL